MSDVMEFGKSPDFYKDPVHEQDGKWYFWTETWADECGPFNSELEARTALKEYAEQL